MVKETGENVLRHRFVSITSLIRKLIRKPNFMDVPDWPELARAYGANRHDSMMFEKCIDALPALKGLRGKPLCRPSKLHADKCYDYARCRAYLKKRGIASRIARRGVESSERLGWHRWVVERTH